MLYMFTIYAVGIVLLILGVAAAVNGGSGSAVLGFLLALVGTVIIFGGLHGAIYKMAGDATARVISRSTPTAKKVASSDKDVRPED